jgi:hypothetical protein
VKRKRKVKIDVDDVYGYANKVTEEDGKIKELRYSKKENQDEIRQEHQKDEQVAVTS